MSDECIPTHYGPQNAPVMRHEYYIQKVLSFGPIAYWPLRETTGTIAECLVNPLQDGAYVGATLADDTTGTFGTPAPYFDGATSYVDIMTAPLMAAWDAGGAEWSFLIWWRVFNVGVWTDGASRYAISCYYDANNYVMAYKGAVNNSLRDGLWRSGGVPESRISNPFSEVSWQCTAVTHSEADDEVIFYRNGGWLETDTTLGVWGSAAPWDHIVIGASATTPANVWSGWLAHCAIWDRVLSSSEVKALRHTAESPSSRTSTKATNARQHAQPSASRQYEVSN